MNIRDGIITGSQIILKHIKFLHSSGNMIFQTPVSLSLEIKGSLGILHNFSR
jgi:hypothetical protein